MRFYSYLNTAKFIIENYDGAVPLAVRLKEFFNANKKSGSRDRGEIAHLCYCFFRLGKSFLEVPIDERILIGLFLCSSEPNEVLAELKAEWNQKVERSADEKYTMLGSEDSMLNVFPWKEQLSEGVDHARFCQSFFVQPDLFLRIRPGYESIVKEKLLKAAIHFEEVSTQCLALPNASKVFQRTSSEENSIEVDREAVIQDYSSQRIGDFFQSAVQDLKFRITAWDCCAASGGKSLLLYDINPSIDLTVSDVRQSILVNLKKRFQKAGIKKYHSFVADLTQPNPELLHKESFEQTSPKGLLRENFELIICDAPCTGSGTWSRTPEQLYFFDELKIGYYASLQKKIVSNIIPRLGENGFLVYITCSVFKKENEEVVTYMVEQFKLELLTMEALKGYDKKADTMFVAVFRRL